jgi:hypothetical protein
VFFCGVFAGCFASFKLARPAFPQRQQVRGPTLLPTSKIFIISAHLFGALYCFVSCFCFFVSSLKIICDDNPFGFCVCVCVYVFGFYFIFLFEISIARFGIMCAVEGRSAVGMKRERERGGGGHLNVNHKGKHHHLKGFCFLLC